jgi:trans-2,3-dihydro-3-hydroxyanthranilate isomerase
VLSLPLTWLDVFTAEPLTGNQLAVVHDADGVADETMAAFARETRLSETTFVQTATAEGADYRNRIWMMRGELPFAGHPSLGTAVAVALARGEREVTYRQQTLAGVQPIDVEVRADGRSAHASMLQEPVTFGPRLDRIPIGEPHPELTAQIVSCGVPQVIAPVRSLDVPKPDFAELEQLLDAHGAVTLYVVVVDGDRARARSFFLDPDGVCEDPATGSAAGPLMAYLHEHTGATRVTVEQGAEMGRPSVLECSVEGDRVRVGGDVVLVARGTVSL